MKVFSRMGMVAAATLLAGTSTSLAQPPGDEMCGQVTTALGETDTSIQGCMDELLEEQFMMIEGIEGMNEEVRATKLALLSARGTTRLQRTVLLDSMADGDDNIDLMREQVLRAMDENAAVEDADYDDAFTKADQEKGNSCKLSDISFFESLDGEFPPGLKPRSGSTIDPKFGDGKCNVFKARIDNPGEPDDDDMVTVNERKENMCERTCEDRESDSDVVRLRALAPKRKDERKERTVFALTDNIAAARRANEDLNSARARISSLRLQLSSQVFRVAGDDEDSCEPVDVARGLDEAGAVAGLVKNAVAIVTVSLELAKETARPPSKQDAAGFNASTAETPFSVAAGVSKIIEESLGFVEQGFTVAALIASRVQDFAQAECLGEVQDGIVALTAIANANGEAIARIDSKVDEVLEQLRTPPGRREGFPAPKTNLRRR